MSTVAGASIIAATMDLASRNARKSREIKPTDSEPAALPPAVLPNSKLPGTILSIQILRFVAAFFVVAFHAHLALVTMFPNHLEDQVDHAFRVGSSGVHIFFVVSGFVMVYTSWRSRLTPANFLRRRLIRIYPIYWLIAGFYLVTHQLLGTPYQLTGSTLFGAALLLPGNSSAVIGPGWTLAFEMYFYLCFAISLFAGLRTGLVLLSFFYAMSMAVGRVLLPETALGKLVTDSLLLEFMVGAWLGYAFANGFVVGRRIGAFLIVVSLMLFASGFWLDYNRLPSVISWGVPSLLLVAGALAFEPQMRSSVGRSFAKLGDSSYQLYLSHVLVIVLVLATPVAALNHNERWAILLSFPIALACTAIAALGYEVIELPMLKGFKRMFLKRQDDHLQPSAAAR